MIRMEIIMQLVVFKYGYMWLYKNKALTVRLVLPNTFK